MKLFNHTENPLDLEAANLRLPPSEHVEVTDEQLDAVKLTKPFLAALSKGHLSMHTDEHFADLERIAAKKRVAELEAKTAAETEKKTAKAEKAKG